jgi:hypothetical protein
MAAEDAGSSPTDRASLPPERPAVLGDQTVLSVLMGAGGLVKVVPNRVCNRAPTPMWGCQRRTRYRGRRRTSIQSSLCRAPSSSRVFSGVGYAPSGGCRLYEPPDTVDPIARSATSRSGPCHYRAIQVRAFAGSRAHHRPSERGTEGQPPDAAELLILWSYRVILAVVKTAISVPDETFERASRRAQDLGVSRSEFFARAATRYLDELDAASLTEQIDLVIASIEAADDSNADAVIAGRRLLIDAADEW